MAGAGYKLFNTGDVLTAAQVNTYLNEQTVMVFASSAARTSALSGVLAEGMMSYLQDTNSVEVYNGTSWVALASGDLTEIVAGTGITVTSGTGPIPTVALTTPVAATNGGTAQSTYTTGDLLYASATNTLAKRAIGSTDQVLKVSGGIPTWAVDPTTDVVTTAGDLIYGSAADTVTRLGIGTAGQVLKVNSGATAPEWGAAAGGGGLTLINTGGTTLTGSSTSVTSIPGTYKNLFVVVDKAYVSSDSDNPGLMIRFNSDTGSNYHYQTINSINNTLSGRGDATNTEYELSCRVSDQNTDIKKSFCQLTVRNYTNTDGVGLSSFANGFNTSEQATCTIGSGSYDGSAAITSISIRPSGSGTLSGGTIFVYGES